MEKDFQRKNVFRIINNNLGYVYIMVVGFNWHGICVRPHNKNNHNREDYAQKALSETSLTKFLYKRKMMLSIFGLGEYKAKIIY